jgi:hypothetical protein
MHEEFVLAEDPEEAEAVPQWQKDLLPKAREVLGSEDFIPLPSRFEIHEWSIMERFARSLTDAAVRDELDAAVHGRGAFRRFKDAVHRLPLDLDSRDTIELDSPTLDTARDRIDASFSSISG